LDLQLILEETTTTDILVESAKWQTLKK